MDARTLLEELYVEYLACSVAALTATELARLSGGQLSHHQITRALAGAAHGPRELWAKVKALVRAAEAEAAGQGVLIVDDTIIAKAHSEESELIGWHFDPTVNRAIKGVNLLTLFWQGAAGRLPVGYALVRKQAPAPGERPRPLVDKNSLFRELARQAKANALCCRAVLAESWFASEANRELVHRELKSTFVFALKANRLAVRAPQDNRRTTAWRRIEALALEEDTPVRGGARRRSASPWPCCATATETWRAGRWIFTSLPTT
jgi:DDE superfamily endonuclease